MTGPTPHPRAVSTTDHAGPRVVGVSGRTLRRLYADDPESVPFVYRTGRRLFVSTPKLHATLHGADAGSWTECQGCWALGADERDRGVQIVSSALLGEMVEGFLGEQR